MSIDRIANPRCAGRVRARHAAERDRPAVGHDEAIPNNEKALIAMIGRGIVCAEKACALRH
jgi:hypothetical protein